MTTKTDTDLGADAAAAIAYLREHDAEHLAQLDEFLSIRPSAPIRSAPATFAAPRNGSSTS